MWTIQLQDTTGQPQHVAAGRVKIGRESDCELKLSGWRVSGKHAELFISNDQGFVRDLGSANGTQVNGKTISTHGPLKPGDKIQIGSHVFTATWIAEVVAPVAAPPAEAPHKTWRKGPVARPDVTAPLEEEPVLAAPVAQPQARVHA